MRLEGLCRRFEKRKAFDTRLLEPATEMLLSGVHERGRGDHPSCAPRNLMPRISEVPPLRTVEKTKIHISGLKEGQPI